MLHDVDALDRLKKRVESAANEIERLRAENAQLAESLRVLWAKTSDGHAGASVVFEGDREELKQRVQSYIKAIDECLTATTA